MILHRDHPTTYAMAKPLIALLAIVLSTWIPVGYAQSTPVTLPKTYPQPPKYSDYAQATPCYLNGAEVICDGVAAIAKLNASLNSRLMQATAFDAVESTYSDLCGRQTPLVDGRWPIIAFDDSLRFVFGTGLPRSRQEEILAKWRLHSPSSVGLAMAEATYWQMYAWDARGRGYARTVSEEGWQLFKERNIKARDALERVPRDQIKCGAWYALRIRVGRHTGEPTSKVWTVFEEGTKRFPRYHSIYFSAAEMLLPKWGGSFEEFERFARRSAEQTAAYEGEGMYARLFWIFDDADELDPKKVNWKRVLKGYADLNSRFPNSWWNANRHASAACRAHDRDTYIAVRTKLGEKLLDRRAWPDDMGPDVCDLRFRYRVGT